MERNLDKVHWYNLSKNPNAIHILEQNLDKEIHWDSLAENPNAIRILEKNLDKFDRINWFYLSMNPNAIHLLFDYDYELMRESKQELSKEMIEFVYHPSRLDRISSLYNMEMDEYLDS